MSKVVIASQPNLGNILTSSRPNDQHNCKLPMILKEDGSFDWNANSFLTNSGGGASTYNIKPLANTVIKKAYSLNLFCSFLELEASDIAEVDDSTLYLFVDHLKDRGVNDDTITKHVRLAIEYIAYISAIQPEIRLACCDNKDAGDYRVHYTTKFFKKGNIEISFLDHSCLQGLIHISTDVEYIRDYQLEMWLDAINCTTYHPDVDDFLLSRWQAFTTLLDITGSRISEVHQITRSMIKEAAKGLLSSNKNPVIRNIPISKGKYKGKHREVVTTKEDIQVLLWHIQIVESMFPDISHDAIFVDSRSGKAIKSSYLKNYAKKVINGSKYCRDLRHLSNHSFRHRFITLTVAKAIKKIADSGSFHNILTVAANACRKITMHASNDTLSSYIHLASEMNQPDGPSEDSQMPTQIKVRLKRMLKIANDLTSDEIDRNEALDSILTTLSELRRISILNTE
ncbi:hypothetical protein [Motiliproteus sp.]|uniref:hypothetical protein n=1 Tax=Motiliproteus sp. TaxID=1898955 RepID=UPI003BA856C5